MIFRKVILLTISFGFTLIASPQIDSSKTLADTAFQEVSNISKQNFFFSLVSKQNDSLLSLKIKPFNERSDINIERHLNYFSRKHLEGLKKIIQEVNNEYASNPFLLNDAIIENVGISDRSLWTDQSYYYNDFEMSSSWTAGGIPMIMDYQGMSLFDIGSNIQHRVSVRFDKDEYIQQLKRKMKDKFDPAGFAAMIKDPLMSAKDQATSLLGLELSDISAGYNGILDQEVLAVLNNPGLFSPGMIDLRKKLTDYRLIQQAQKNEEILATLQQKINLGEKVDAEVLDNLKSTIQKVEARQFFLQKIEQHKRKWESSGLLKRIREFELLKKGRIEQIVSDPAFVRKQAKQYLTLKGLQKFFLNVNRFNLGSDALTLSPLSFNHFLQNGFNTEFVNKKGNPLMLVLGKQKDFNSVLDHGFEGSLFSNTGQVRAARIGLKSSARSASQISVSSFQQSLAGGIITPVSAMAFRDILVTTISNQITIGQHGNIDVDISRSAGSYRGESQEGGSLRDDNNFSKLISSDLMANTAISLRYSDELPAEGLSYQFNFSKAANGYTNPGNPFLNSGSTEFGGNLKKSMLKNRMQLSVRGNLKNYKFNDELDRSWRNTYFIMDARWRMNKGQSITVRYQPNRMSRIVDGNKSNISSIDRLSLEANVYKKIRKTGYRNYLAVAYQKNRYAVTVTENILATSLQVNSFQNITLGKNLLYVNFSYIHSFDVTQYVYFNSSVNSDAGLSYSLSKRIMATSGIVYSSVNEWYRQLGLRQTITGDINKKFSINLYIDARKNLSVSRALWVSPIRADLSLRYIVR